MPVSRTQGFGTGQGVEGVVVSPDLAEEMLKPEQAAAEYLRQIRDRYVLPGGMKPDPFRISALAMQKFDYSQNEYNGFLVSIQSGVALVYFGDYTSATGQNNLTAHWIIGATIAGQAQQIAVPPGPYIITIQADASGTAVGCITPMAL